MAEIDYKNYFLMEYLKKHHIKELHNIMADVAKYIVRPSYITWNCGFGSITMTFGKVEELLKEPEDKLREKALPSFVHVKEENYWPAGDVPVDEEKRKHKEQSNNNSVSSNKKLDNPLLEEAKKFGIAKENEFKSSFGFTTIELINAFMAGANWQKEQMMKYTIEDVQIFDFGGNNHLDFCFDDNVLLEQGFKDEDKVKLIILKEE